MILHGVYFDLVSKVYHISVFVQCRGPSMLCPVATIIRTNLCGHAGLHNFPIHSSVLQLRHPISTASRKHRIYLHPQHNLPIIFARWVLFDNIFWAATSSQINRWRRDSLKLEPTVMSHAAQSKIPLLYNFSSVSPFYSTDLQTYSFTRGHRL